MLAMVVVDVMPCPLALNSLLCSRTSKGLSVCGGEVLAIDKTHFDHQHFMF